MSEKRTVVILTPNFVREVDDIHKFSTSVPIDRIIELIKQEEAHRTSEQIIGEIKMQRFEGGETWPEKSNVMSAGSNGRSAQTRATTKRSISVRNVQSS